MYETRWAVVAVAVAAAVAGCGDSSEPCATGVTDGAITIAVDGYCLRDVEAMRLREQAWDGAAAVLESDGAGAVRVTLGTDAPASGLRLRSYSCFG